MAEKAEIVMEIDSNVGEVTKDVEKLDDATKKGATGFKGMATAAKGFGLALKAAGIGLIVAAFMALKEALGRNQKVMNTVNTVMTTVSTTFNQVVGVLIDVYDWVTQSSERFNGLTKVISGLLTIALTPLKLSFYAIKLGVQGAMLAWENSFLGGGDEKKIAELRASIAQTTNDIKEVGLSAVDAGKDIFNNISDAIGEIQAIGEVAIKGISDISIKANYEQAKATTAAQNSSKLAEAQIQGLIEKNDLLAETQRQIRDDETKTFAERIAANNELNNILDTQEQEMLKLADTRVASAALELAANKENIELQVAYQQTLNDRAGVEAQIAGFRSEQMTNEVSLNKELLESQREIAQEGLSGMEKELLELENSYKQKLLMADKSGMATTAIEAQYAKQKAAIVKANMLTQVEAYAGLATALMGLAGESKELAVAEAIIATYLGATKALGATGTPIDWVNAAAIIVGGMANVNKILSTDVGGGGGGGSVGATAQTPAPQMMQGAFTLGGGIEPEPARAYVVSDDITNNQNKLAIIRRRATI
jgi:hypothetical protein